MVEIRSGNALSGACAIPEQDVLNLQDRLTQKSKHDHHDSEQVESVDPFLWPFQEILPPLGLQENVGVAPARPEVGASPGRYATDTRPEAREALLDWSLHSQPQALNVLTKGAFVLSDSKASPSPGQLKQIVSQTGGVTAEVATAIVGGVLDHLSDQPMKKLPTYLRAEEFPRTADTGHKGTVADDGELQSRSSPIVVQQQSRQGSALTTPATARQESPTEALPDSKTPPSSGNLTQVVSYTGGVTAEVVADIVGRVLDDLTDRTLTKSSEYPRAEETPRTAEARRKAATVFSADDGQLQGRPSPIEVQQKGRQSSVLTTPATVRQESPTVHPGRMGTSDRVVQNSWVYKFRSWGKEHAVTILSTLGSSPQLLSSLTLQPTSALVEQRLNAHGDMPGSSDQWVFQDHGDERRQQQDARHQYREQEEDES
ncbi:hypothetical protein [Solimicrobium silvestre]|uniref:Surface presentation of antigen domain-containing protein n=1 Tax=Solimicrobium silvestre TaxID=2099400 RepID=A0A2S9H1K8_9BURK|nr:hypothetical protein [Solimicrobium silvestre]PRC93862.1 hypothetical protein S2091_1471 [Solimicrobium silvestre]